MGAFAPFEFGGLSTSRGFVVTGSDDGQLGKQATARAIAEIIVSECERSLQNDAADNLAKAQLSLAVSLRRLKSQEAPPR